MACSACSDLNKVVYSLVIMQGVEDFCGTQGFDAITKRLKDGRDTCKSLVAFLRAR